MIDRCRALARGFLGHQEAVRLRSEGVDIPDVDTVLMLRPTESSIVFLQQLGRGLRAAPDKEHLTVIDYIGNHRSFRLKPQTLFQLDPGDAHVAHVLQLLEEDDTAALDLPPGCEVTYELEAIDLLRSQLLAPRAADEMATWYRDFEDRTGRRPLAVEAFHEGRNPRSVRTSHGSWLRFVAAQGGLTPEEQAALDLNGGGPFLAELERTRMTRSFKMIILLAMIRAGTLPGGLDIDTLARDFRVLAERSARVRDEVTVDLADNTALRSYLETNPIRAWSSPQGSGRQRSTYFAYEGTTFSTTFDVPQEHREAFSDLVTELAHWRIADYLGDKPVHLEGELVIQCKVIDNRRDPIIKLPDRARNENIPEGDVEVLVEGKRLVARFAKIAVNVVRNIDGDENVLPDILRRWFGPETGRPSTRAMVAFTKNGEEWTLAPVLPEAPSGVTRSSTQTASLQVLDEQGAPLDATYELEEWDGQVDLIYHARGGTRGSASARNTEYARGLEVLLGRLREAGASIERIVLDTRETTELPTEKRQLKLRGERAYPLEMTVEADVSELRRAISAAQGSNPTRRIRMSLSGEAATIDEWKQQLAP